MEQTKDYFNDSEMNVSFSKKRPRLLKVRPLGNYLLLLDYSNGEKRVFNGEPLFDWHEHYDKLRDTNFFNEVYIAGGTLVWDNEIDIDPVILYESSEKIE